MQPDLSKELLDRGYRYALALCHQREEAEDLVQEVWLALHERHPDKASQLGYFFKSLRNRFVDQKRRAHRFPTQTLDPNDPLKQASVAVFEGRSTLDKIALERALGGLRSTEREVLYLTMVEGFTVRETAAVTGHPVGTVASLLSRSRQKLRQQLRSPSKEAL